MRSRSSVKVLGIESTIIIRPFHKQLLLMTLTFDEKQEQCGEIQPPPQPPLHCVEPEMPARAPRTESIKYKTCWAIIQSSLITLHSAKGDIKVQLRVYGTPSHHKPQDLNRAPRPWSQSCPECAPLNISLSLLYYKDYLIIPISLKKVSEGAWWLCDMMVWLVATGYHDFHQNTI